MILIVNAIKKKKVAAETKSFWRERKARKTQHINKRQQKTGNKRQTAAEERKEEGRRKKGAMATRKRSTSITGTTPSRSSLVRHSMSRVGHKTLLQEDDEVCGSPLLFFFFPLSTKARRQRQREDGEVTKLKERGKKALLVQSSVELVRVVGRTSRNNASAKTHPQTGLFAFIAGSTVVIQNLNGTRPEKQILLLHSKTSSSSRSQSSGSVAPLSCLAFSTSGRFLAVAESGRELCVSLYDLLPLLQ